jgi:ectoine hydroxylase-related dioxygenase (phytanoyl-CoA dioxygenase family)
MQSYGVLEQSRADDALSSAAEEIACLGYSVIDSGYPAQEVDDLKRIFEDTHRRYLDLHGASALAEIDEHNGIRLPLALNARFIELAANERVLRLVETLIRNTFILNQQNGVINPANGTRYNQDAWHRDLPYQHFVSSRPLAVNALYCVDDFTAENGATFVVPASHKHESFPSAAFIDKHARQISAPAGSFIVLDCMVYHRGGENRTSTARRGVNHVYTSAFIRQQIDIPAVLGSSPTRPELSDLLGYRYRLPRTVSEFLAMRRR